MLLRTPLSQKSPIDLLGWGECMKITKGDVVMAWVACGIIALFGAAMMSIALGYNWTP